MEEGYSEEGYLGEGRGRACSEGGGDVWWGGRVSREGSFAGCVPEEAVAHSGDLSDRWCDEEGGVGHRKISVVPANGGQRNYLHSPIGWIVRCGIVPTISV